MFTILATKLHPKRWGLAVSVALMITLTLLLPASAQAGAPCYLNGSWYADGTIIHAGPILQVCDDGRWRVVVFHQWDLIQRIDAMLLKKFDTTPPIPDPQPWCLSCPPELTVTLDSKTTQLVEQEMTKVMESLKTIQQLMDNDPVFRGGAGR